MVVCPTDVAPDDPTSYYLLHRHDFGFGEAPAGTCILYAVSCGLSDRELVDNWNLLSKGGGSTATTNGNDVDPDAVRKGVLEDREPGTLEAVGARRERVLDLDRSAVRHRPILEHLDRLVPPLDPVGSCE